MNQYLLLKSDRSLVDIVLDDLPKCGQSVKLLYLLLRVLFLIQNSCVSEMCRTWLRLIASSSITACV